jgi:hypothetical protein
MDYTKAMQILRTHQVEAPAIVQHSETRRFYVYSGMKQISFGATVEDALRAGGFLIPPAHPIHPFVHEGLLVHWRSRLVCTAASKTLAQRIANALNEYIPGKRAR